MADENVDIPQTVHRWWPVVTAVLMISGFISTAVAYYAKAETREMIKVELIEPLKEFSIQADEMKQKLGAIERQQIMDKTKFEFMLELMERNNDLLNDQKDSIEELKK